MEIIIAGYGFVGKAVAKNLNTPITVLEETAKYNDKVR
jgi:Trk K+ transport system NAD-binding subunit